MTSHATPGDAANTLPFTSRETRELLLGAVPKVNNKRELLLLLIEVNALIDTAALALTQAAASVLCGTRPGIRQAAEPDDALLDLQDDRAYLTALLEGVLDASGEPATDRHLRFAIVASAESYKGGTSALRTAQGLLYEEMKRYDALLNAIEAVADGPEV